MVYLSGGQISDKAPWSLQAFINFFWGSIYLVMYFFLTLFGLEDKTNSRRIGFRSGFVGGSSGRGGGNGPGGGGPRRMGNVKSIDDYSMPGGGCSGGGCSGGGCFR